MSYFPRTSAEINVAEMRQQLPAKQQLEQLREQAKQALLNVSLNRKKLYDIVVDLKEHFQEYGFKSPAAAVENVIPRSKSWANKFCAEIESELEIGEVANLVATEPDKTEKKEQKALSKVEKAREEPDKPPVKTADEVIAENGHVEPVKPQAKPEPAASLDLSVWTNKVLTLFSSMPKSKLYNKLDPAGIKTFETAMNSLYSVLGEFLPKKPEKILCKCGCGLSAEVSQRLFAVGVPCKGLTVGQAGLIMKKMSENEWKLPGYFAFLKNEGEWVERQFKGKPRK